MGISYDDFIQNIIDTRGRNGCKDNYFEKHHILPKCIGGNDKNDNLIDLYADEHFIAHKLLAEQYPDNIKITNTYIMMAFVKNPNQPRKQLTPEEYEKARKTFSSSMKERWKDPEYRSLQSRINRERWKNPEYRKLQSENRTRLNYEMWKDECFRKKMGEKSKARWENASADELKKRKESMQNISNMLWENVEYIKKHCTPVFCLETQEFFLCQQDAIKKYHISASGLSSHLSGRQKSAGKHPKTRKPLHWRKSTWEECELNSSFVCHSDRINLLGNNES